MKYYIATKLENHKAHNILRDELNRRGHECTYDWTEHGPVYKDGIERIKEIAQEEANGVLKSDCLIMLWPGGRGTHVELGIALGSRDVDVVIISDVEDHHQATTETCAFYHHPDVNLFKSVDEFFNSEYYKTYFKK